jgi:RecG-like helicase
MILKMWLIVNVRKVTKEDFAMDKFILKAPYKPTGDQPKAIEQIVKGFKEGNQCQTYGFWKNFYDGKCY